MRIKSRKLGRHEAAMRIYSGPEAKRRAAGMSPEMIEWLARQVRLHTDGRRQAVALLVCCVLTAGLTAALWFAFRGISK